MADLPFDDVARFITAFGIVAIGAIPAAGLLLWLVGWQRVLPRWRRWSTGWTSVDVFAFVLFSLALPAFVLIALDSPGISQTLFGAEVPVRGEAVAAAVGGAVGAEINNSAEERKFRRTSIAIMLALPLILLAFRAMQVISGRENSPPLGSVIRRIPGEIALGTIAWLILTPITFAVHFAVNALYLAIGGQPENHPLTQLDPGRTVGFAVLFLASTCVASPLYEELVFRRLLLPWALRPAYHAWVLMVLAGAVASLRGGSLDSPRGFSAVLFVVCLGFGLYLIQLAQTSAPRIVRQRTAAVYSTATLFAALHAPVWPSPVPLFVLGLGLGYLVVRTQSVGAAAICHGLFNAVSCVVLLRGN